MEGIILGNILEDNIRRRSKKKQDECRLFAMNMLMKIVAPANLLLLAASGKVGSLSDLRPLLSLEASIYLPGPTGYADAMTR